MIGNMAELQLWDFPRNRDQSNETVTAKIYLFEMSFASSAIESYSTSLFVFGTINNIRVWTF